MNTIILARVSTKEQEEGHSIDAQIARLQEGKTRGLNGITFEQGFSPVEIGSGHDPPSSARGGLPPPSLGLRRTSRRAGNGQD